MEVGFVIALGVVGVLAVSAMRARKEAASLRERFRPVLDAEREAARIRSTIDASAKEAAVALQAIENDVSDLRAKYAAGLKRHDALRVEVSRLEESLEAMDVGLYRPHFTYEDSEKYKTAIEEVREAQRRAMKDGRATTCGTTWTVGGSRREGERMVKQTEKLILRAFNAESEAAVSNVTWRNSATMRARIEKAFEVLNKHGTVLQVSITAAYRDLRLRELQLVQEAADKKRLEQEGERERRAALREEEAVQRERERAREEAEQEEVGFEKALSAAQAQLAKARDSEREAMLTRIAALERDLAAAHERKERAIAQAQMTKVGHVYIISNIGAFGDRIVKIGMTRRLEPHERVKELGDASVPFPFDLHALIYSEDAPDLESKLHSVFWERRLNRANDRKEFFAVGLEEVQGALNQLGVEAEIRMIPEAREYRETMAVLSEQGRIGTAKAAAAEQKRLPADPFELSGPT